MYGGIRMPVKRDYPIECASFIEQLQQGERLGYLTCLAAIRICPELFYEITPKDHRLFLEVIKQNPLFLKEVYQPTVEMIYEALRGNPLTLKYVRSLTDEYIKLALQRDFSQLKEVSEVDEKLLDWMRSLREIKRSLVAEIPTNYKQWTVEDWKKGLHKNGLWLKYLSPKKQTMELCKIAVAQNPKALVFATHRTYRMCRYMVQDSLELKEFSPYHFDN